MMSPASTRAFLARFDASVVVEPPLSTFRKVRGSHSAFTANFLAVDSSMVRARMWAILLDYTMYHKMQTFETLAKFVFPT